MIVPMALVRIYGPRELLDEATCILYELEALHLEALPPDLAARVSVRDRRTDDRAEVHERVELEALFDKVRRSLILLPHPKTASTGSASCAAPTLAAFPFRACTASTKLG